MNKWLNEGWIAVGCLAYWIWMDKLIKPLVEFGYFYEGSPGSWSIQIKIKPAGWLNEHGKVMWIWLHSCRWLIGEAWISKWWSDSRWLIEDQLWFIWNTQIQSLQIAWLIFLDKPVVTQLCFPDQTFGGICLNLELGQLQQCFDPIQPWLIDLNQSSGLHYFNKMLYVICMIKPVGVVWFHEHNINHFCLIEGLNEFFCFIKLLCFYIDKKDRLDIDGIQIWLILDRYVGLDAVLRLFLSNHDQVARVLVDSNGIANCWKDKGWMCKVQFLKGQYGKLVNRVNGMPLVWMDFAKILDDYNGRVYFGKPGISDGIQHFVKGLKDSCCNFCDETSNFGPWSNFVSFFGFIFCWVCSWCKFYFKLLLVLFPKHFLGMRLYGLGYTPRIL